MKNKRWEDLTREDLYYLYVDKNLTLDELAEIFFISKQAVFAKMKNII
jgi:hypothetical protein